MHLFCAVSHSGHPKYLAAVMPAIFTYVRARLHLRVRIYTHNIMYNLIIHADVYYHIIGQSVQKGALTPPWVDASKGDWELTGGGHNYYCYYQPHLRGRRVHVCVCVTSGVRGLD
jgi:hypothetical protein